ncbi:MAG: hypothetical protein WCS42_14880, partial [Verrucomicrobiota bacterium]
LIHCFDTQRHSIAGATATDFHIRRVAVAHDHFAFARVQEKKRRFENSAILAYQGKFIAFIKARKTDF